MGKCKNNVGAKNQSNNDYRSISNLPFLSKLFERNIHIQISKHPNDKRLLAEKQYCFSDKHSCVTALKDVADDLRSLIDNGQLMCLVLLNHSKAFVCVHSDTLCKKIKYLYNYSSTAVQLISNYLQHRTLL